MISSCFIACNKDEDIVIDNDNTSQVNLPYEVIEYLPAPGQFINEKVSGFEKITTMTEACAQAENRLKENLYVSLGAWGGYITVRFKNSIRNTEGYDFAIASNSFDSSNEPGIVWVMKDTNGNNQPDDTWYELKGSYYGQEGFATNFSVTYYRPQPGEDTFWKASDGEEGYVKWIGSFHSQDFYYPNWVNADSYTLSGSKMPAKVTQNPVTGIWSNLPFDWGYADNSGKDLGKIEVNGISLDVNRFRISDAVDNTGKPVKLESIDFIKVQTAILSDTDLLGENSTEVCGFFAL
ncbi:MAG: cell surface protein [Muribaculaceae bacterium]|nr:cell surface protein [Muribaculaceae bacterium]